MAPYSISKTSTTWRPSLHLTDRVQISYTVSCYHKTTFETLTPCTFQKGVFRSTLIHTRLRLQTAVTFSTEAPDRRGETHRRAAAATIAGRPLSPGRYGGHGRRENGSGKRHVGVNFATACMSHTALSFLASRLRGPPKKIGFKGLPTHTDVSSVLIHLLVDFPPVTRQVYNVCVYVYMQYACMQCMYACMCVCTQCM